MLQLLEETPANEASALIALGVAAPASANMPSPNFANWTDHSKAFSLGSDFPFTLQWVTRSQPVRDSDTIECRRHRPRLGHHHWLDQLPATGQVRHKLRVSSSRVLDKMGIADQ